MGGVVYCLNSAAQSVLCWRDRNNPSSARASAELQSVSQSRFALTRTLHDTWELLHQEASIKIDGFDGNTAVARRNKDWFSARLWPRRSCSVLTFRHVTEEQMNSFALFTPVQTSRVLSLPSALTTADTHTPKEQNDPSESDRSGQFCCLCRMGQIQGRGR